MTADSIRSCLPPDFPWADHITCFPCLDSTNNRLKLLAAQGAPHGTVLLSDRQTAGRGRRGRSFHSPAGVGIYMSVLLRPDCPPDALMHLTCAAAVALCDAVKETTGILPGIKWTNDLVVGRRKLAGILTELVLDSRGHVSGAILGVGINCLQRPEDFPEELREMAVSLAQLTPEPPSRARLAAAMLEAFCRMDRYLLSCREQILSRYRSLCVTLGQPVSLLRGDTVRHGRAVDLNAQGALIVEFPDGHRETVDSGEVSVRGMYGYL